MAELPPSLMRLMRSSAPTTSAPASVHRQHIRQQLMPTPGASESLHYYDAGCLHQCDCNKAVRHRSPITGPDTAYPQLAPPLRCCPLQTPRRARASLCRAAARQCHARRGPPAWDRCPALAAAPPSHRIWHVLLPACHNRCLISAGEPGATKGHSELQLCRMHLAVSQNTMIVASNCSTESRTFTKCSASGSVHGGGLCFSPLDTKRGSGSNGSSSLRAALGTAADGCGEVCKFAACSEQQERDG